MESLFSSLKEAGELVVILFDILIILDIVMFILATIITIVFFRGRKNRKQQDEELGMRVIFPILLYCVSLPTLLGLVVFCLWSR